MKKVMLSALLAICISGSFAQGTSSKATVRPAYDASFAQEVGADEYGMRGYVMGILKKGKKEAASKAIADSLQLGHLKNVWRLADEGKLVLGGPFIDDKQLRGIFIYNTASLEEAKRMVATDPAVVAGIFEIELHRWYGTAALLKVVDLHKKIEKIDPTK